MLLNYAQAFAVICADLEKFRGQLFLTMAQAQDLTLVPEMPKMRDFRQGVGTLLATCQQVPQLDRMNGPLGRLLATLDNPIDGHTLHHSLDFIQLQLMDELNRMKLYLVPENLAPLYENEIPFGQKVFDNFPSAVRDSQNAARCLAIGQPTAAMFHLTRVMERGLEAYAAKLGIPYSPSWESYIKHLNNHIAVDWSKKEKVWKSSEPFHKDILGDITAIKIAWRNPTVHISDDYSFEEAMRAYSAVNGFMERLAGKVKEKRAAKR